MKVYELPAATGLDSWILTERPDPKPTHGQALVKLHAASLNYRDVLLATGRYGFSKLPAHLVPVSDGAGEVVEIGAGVTRVRPGDRVAGIFSQNWIGGAQSPDVRDSSLGGAIDGVSQFAGEYSDQPSSPSNRWARAAMMIALAVSSVRCSVISSNP